MDKRRIQEVLGMMTKNLECSICLELLKNPVTTKCDHQFCRFCIIQFINKKRSVPCPLCKKPVTERSLQEREELAIIVQNIRDLITAFQEDSGDIFSPPKGPSLQCFFPSTPEPLNNSLPRSKGRSSKPISRKDSSRTSSNVSLIPSESENDDSGDLQRTVKMSTRRKSNLTTQTKLQNGDKHDKGNTTSRGLQCGTPKEVQNSCASIIEPSPKYPNDGFHQRFGFTKTKLIDSANTQKSKPNGRVTNGILASKSCPIQQKETTKPKSASPGPKSICGSSVNVSRLKSSNFSKDNQNARKSSSCDANEIISLPDTHQNFKDLSCYNMNHSGTEKQLKVVKPTKHTPVAKKNIRQSKRKSCEVTLADELLSVLEDGSLGANTTSTQSSFLHVTKDSNDMHIEPVEKSPLKTNMDSLLNSNFPERSSIVSKEGEELSDHGSILEVHDDFGTRNYSEKKKSSIDSNESLSAINGKNSTKTAEIPLSPQIIIQNPIQSRIPILNKSCPKANISKDKDFAMSKLTPKRQPKKINRRRKIHNDSEEFVPSETTDDDVIPETIQTNSQIRETSQSSNVSYDVKFYDSPSKDPNRQKSRPVNQKTTRRMSDRFKKIKKKKDMESPETCLTQGGVKSPKLVTRTYGRFQKGRLVKKTREDESWKKIVPAEDETTPQESEGSDSNVQDEIEDSHATSVESYSSAFGFNTQNLAKDEPKKTVNPKVGGKLLSRSFSTKQSASHRMPRGVLIPKGKVTATCNARTPLSQVHNDTSTPPHVTSICTSVSSHGTPLKYGRGKLLPSPFNRLLDTSLLSKSAENSSGYFPKRTNNNRKVNVKMDAKGKLHMSLENRKSPRHSRNALKSISNTADILTARGDKAAPPIMTLDPFEFKSSQTPKDRKKKQTRHKKSAKKSNRLAILGKKAALAIFQENHQSSKESSRDNLKRSVTFAETDPVVIDITQDSTHSDSESVLIEDTITQDFQNPHELIHPEEEEYHRLQKPEEPPKPNDSMKDPKLPDISRPKQSNDSKAVEDDDTSTSEVSTKINHQSSSTTENDITCIADSVEEDGAGSSSEKQDNQETTLSQSGELFSGLSRISPQLCTYEDSNINSRYIPATSSGRKQHINSTNRNHTKKSMNANFQSCSPSKELFSVTGRKSQDSISNTLATPKMFSSSNAQEHSTCIQISSSPVLDKISKNGAIDLSTVDPSPNVISKSQIPKARNNTAKNYVELESTVQHVPKDNFVEETVNHDDELPGPIPATSTLREKRKSFTRSPVMSDIRNSDLTSRPRRKRKSLERLSTGEEKCQKTSKNQTEVLKTTCNVSPSLPCTKASNEQPNTSTNTDLMTKPSTRDKTKTKPRAKRGRRKNSKEPENQEQEMLQLMNKINNAEDHDFMFSTQEVYSSMDSEPAVPDTISSNHEIQSTGTDKVKDKVENYEDNEFSANDERVSDEEAVEDSVLIRRSDEDIEAVEDSALVRRSDEDIEAVDDSAIGGSAKDVGAVDDSAIINGSSENEKSSDEDEEAIEDSFLIRGSDMEVETPEDVIEKGNSPQEDEANDCLGSSLVGPSADLLASMGGKLENENSENVEMEFVNDMDDFLNDDDYSPVYIKSVDLVLKNKENEACSSDETKCTNSETNTKKISIVSEQNNCLQNKNPDKDLSTPLLYSPSQYKSGQSSSNKRSTVTLKSIDTHTATSLTDSTGTTQTNVQRTTVIEEPLINEHVSDSIPLFSVLEPFQPLNASSDNPKTRHFKRLHSQSSLELSPGSTSKESKQNVNEVPKKKRGRKTRSIQDILRSNDESDQSLNDSVQSLTCIPPTPMVEKKLSQSQKAVQRESDKLDDGSMETQDLTTSDLKKENERKENGVANKDIDLQLSGTGAEQTSSDQSRSSKSKLEKKNKDRFVQNEEKASNNSSQTETASESILKPDTTKVVEPTEPSQQLDSRKSLFSDNPSDKSIKECLNVGLEELSQGVPSDFSGSESSLLKRKRSFSCLRKQSRSGTPSSQNSCASFASDLKGNQHNDLQKSLEAEANGLGSSEDELNIRRKKRKCFSLEGSPISNRSRNSQSNLSNQMSQSSDKSTNCQNQTEAVDNLSQLNDKSDTNQNENVKKIVRKKKSIFTKHSKNGNNDSPKLQSGSIDNSYDKNNTGSQMSQNSDILIIDDSHNSERSKQLTSIKSSKPQLSEMSKGNSSQNLKKNRAKSEQDCLDSQEDVIEIRSSTNPQRQTALENAETLPPSGLPMEWNKDDFSEDEVIQDSFENENTIKESEVVGKEMAQIKDTLLEISDDEKENKVEDHDDEAVKDDHCGVGEIEKDSCNEVEDNQYADLPLTSSPVMATGRSVLSGLQACGEDQSDSDDDDVLRKVKRKKSAVIESDEDNLSDNESSTHMNSSSAFSSQSEVTTQQRGAITSNILKMKEKIKQLEAELAVKGSGGALDGSDSDSSDSDSSDSIRVSSKKKKQKEITTIRSSPEIENTKSDDSDNDLFLSPLQYSPPALDQEDDPQLPEVNSMPNLLNQLTEQHADDDDNTDEEDEIDDKSSKVKKQDLMPSHQDPVIQDDDDSDESLPPTPQIVPKIRDNSPVHHSQNPKVTQNEQKDQIVDCVADSLPLTLNKEDRNSLSDDEEQNDIENAQRNLKDDPEPMSEEFDTCLESEEDMDQTEIPDFGEQNVKSSDEDVADMPDEVKKAMEILQKYKSEMMNSQNSAASKQSNRSTPNSKKNQKLITEKSPLVNSGKISTPSRISLDEIDQTLRDITPNRVSRIKNSMLSSSSDSTPIRRIPKFSSRKTTPLQSPMSSKDATPSKDSSIIFQHKVPQSKTIESPRTQNHNSVIKRTPDSQKSERVKTPNRQTTPGSKLASEKVPAKRNENLRCNFAASGLSKDQAENVIKLAGLNDCKFYGKINKHITHLIVRTVSKESRVCERTLKFFQAIAHKIWIVCYSWVEESLKAGKMVVEDPYEIIGDTVTGDCHYGPSLSRLSQDKLFQNLAVTCVGTSDDMSKADMVNLFESLGATVVGDVDSLSCLRSKSKVKKLIVSNKDTVDTELPPDERNCYKNYYSTTGLVTVSREWVLDCISTYKLLSIKNYLFTPRPVRLPF